MAALVRGAAAALLGAALASSLRRENPALALAVAAVTGGCVLALAIPDLREAVEALRTLELRADLAAPVRDAVWKCVAIAIVARLAAGFCADAGQSAAAAGIELLGAAAALCAALPLLETVIAMMEALL